MTPIPEPPVPEAADPPAGPGLAGQRSKEAAMRHTDPRAAKPWMRMAVLATAMAITSSSGIGLAALMVQGPSEPATTPLAFYITDAPAELTALDVSIASVTAGPDRIPLKVMAPAFDLAALQGPDAAVLLAHGDVPADAMGLVEVTFSSARATVDGHSFELPLAQTLVVDGIAAPSQSSPAFLIDVDLPSSLATGPDGRLQFAPTAGAILGGPSPLSGAAPSWKPLKATPRTAAGLEPAGVTAPAGHDWAQEMDVPDRLEDGPLPWNRTDLKAPITTGATFENGTTPGWFVVFNDENASRADMRAAVGLTGAVFVTSLKSIPAAYVLATMEQAEWLADHPNVERVEAEVAIRYHDTESRAALQMAAVTDPVSGLRDGQGRPIDGSGIGVAVVDTGIDGTHPAFQRSGLIGDSVLGDNRKVVSQAFVPLANTDTTAGHGTHVAAIIAGQGTADDALPGIAPGVTLYGLGVGDARSIMWPTQAFDWILQNHDKVDPPIRVVTNSWGSEGLHDPDSVMTRLVNRMASQGIVVVFSAGNDGGDGSTAQTSAQCQIPQPGVICVAAYDDMETGTRDGEVAPYSSRGQASKPDTWPDVSAPGTDVRSARTVAGTSTGVGFYRYVELSGTSQAAPHVAGVAALMLQMDPDLKAGDVETMIKQTAHDFIHEGSYSQHGHYAKGHGLVDAHAAVAAVG